MSWLTLAILSAIFAALTSILAKIGIKGIDSNLATAVRTTVVLLFTWILVWLQQKSVNLAEISTKSWIFLVLSGLATGLSWLFYFKALQIGQASQVVPIDKLSLVMTIILATLFLGEKLTWGIFIGAALMSVGAILVAKG